MACVLEYQLLLLLSLALFRPHILSFPIEARERAFSCVEILGGGDGSGEEGEGTA